jgi:very-short-patch-repair endonuclease
MKHKVSKYKIDEDLYRCECGKEFNNYQSLNGHFSHCKIHRIAVGKGDIPINHRGKKFSEYSKEELATMYKKAGATIKRKIASGEIVPTWSGKKLPEEMKEKIRKGRVKFLQENPGQHGAWNKENKSYLENWFEEFYLSELLDEKHDIQFNYSVYPYFLDFAFVDLKLDVEVDGKFHYTYETNIEHDKTRNETLEKLGWRIYRISIDEVNSDPNKVKKEFLEYLKNYNRETKSRYY